MKLLRILGISLVFACLAACDDKTEVAAPPPQQVRVIAAAVTQYQPSAEITGEVKARIQTELSFRVSGRVIERRVDVGSHVRAGEVLARLNDTEQQADVNVARAALESAKAVFKQKTLAFERSTRLIQSQVIAKEMLDAAQKELLSAQAALETAAAALATAEDALSYTELKAGADGIVTARGIEVGQVVSAAQSAFTLAHDGPRDAVFDVFEAFFLNGAPSADVVVAPVGDRTQEVQANVREVSPVIDTKAGTIRIKVGLQDAAQWPLGTPVVGEIQSSPREGIVLPYSAIASDKGETAVWLVNSENRSVSLRKISVDRYRKSDFVVARGVSPSDLIVTEGGKFLREGQVVAWEGK
ncbi:efflux RND transporter periplasmic adaptor subunit [Rhizobiaceae bacterium n13]|uniref:Efflux RND transporter periplasmic adaptor subunit n=1 Tax=Ferirhizobium litorale TaxID=2927786 RepID=A0AAE3QIP4_9HYPH|nr:efflux RND transporter periplasmic adaptor subunit [Fererhizobium litorale]MDI7862618.1 efflux RND transporter periplasmic adaptor subunit [Fererhizobium litorale]MDI7923899.1 efflux RND transporter periplasmic adaptor subunit [Fererhizobium litorale]